jgi:glycosyltransferase involved in cell wall biosynthesis
MRIRFLSPYHNQSDEPTFRYRTDNVIKGLRARGWDADQFADLKDTSDVGIIHCFSSLATALKIRMKCRCLIYDVNDNLFFLENDHMCSRFLAECADMIVCASQYLMKRYHPLNNNCFWIPDLIDAVGSGRNGRAQRGSAADEVVIVWTGHRDNVRYLAQVIKPLMEMSKKHSIMLKVITSETGDSVYPTIEKLKALLPSVKIHFVKWTRDTCFDELKQSDIAIAPLFNDEFCKSKSENKLITYMQAGLPVIASPIPAYENVIRSGYNGYLASTNEQWGDALEQLIEDGDLRHTIGARGKSVCRYFEEENVLSMWETVFMSIRHHLS